MGFLTKFLTVIVVIVGLIYEAESWPLIALAILFCVEPVVTKTGWNMNQLYGMTTQVKFMSLAMVIIWAAQICLCIYAVVTIWG